MHTENITHSLSGFRPDPNGNTTFIRHLGNDPSGRFVELGRAGLISCLYHYRQKPNVIVVACLEPCHAFFSVFLYFQLDDRSSLRLILLENL